MLTNDGNGLSGGAIVAGNPVQIVRGAVEVFLDHLLSVGESIPTAHTEELSQTG